MSHVVFHHTQRWNHRHHSNCSLGNSHWNAKGEDLCLILDQYVKLLFRQVFGLVVQVSSIGRALGLNIRLTLHVWSHRRPSPESSRETLKYLEPYFLRGPEVRNYHLTHVHQNLLGIQNHPQTSPFAASSRLFASFALIYAAVCLMHIFLCRCKHGDVGSPGFVGGRPELRPRHRSRCWELLWSSRVYVPSWCVIPLSTQNFERRFRTISVCKILIQSSNYVWNYHDYEAKEAVYGTRLHSANIY